MLYLLLLYNDPTVPFPEDGLEGHFKLAADLRAKNAYVASEALSPVQSATTVRGRNGKIVVTDGPFAETKEVLGGLYLIDCRDLDEAIGYARRIPEAGIMGSVEIRPVVGVPGWEYKVGADRARVGREGGPAA